MMGQMGLIKKILVISVLLILGWMVRDLVGNAQIEVFPTQAPDKYEPNGTGVLWALENGETPDYQALLDACAFVDARYDKADFTLHTLIRIMYQYEDQLPLDIQEEMKKTFLGFKYWMDQPGQDSMCYWSENHQILFASAEYLIGQMYPDEVFSNDQRLGEDHQKDGEKRVFAWLEQRWLYGFSEWYSNNYYKEDLLALSQIMDYSNNESMVVQAKIVTDLLFYDVASQSYKGTFVSTSGRLYEANKKSGHGNRLNRIEEVVWGFDLEAKDGPSGLDLSFLYNKAYKVPDLMKEIAWDPGPRVIKASNGLNVSELNNEGLLGQEDHQMMMQWGMEAFTNPEVINNSLAYIRDHQLFSNAFLTDFRLMNIGLIRETPVLPLVSDKLNLKTNGVALQRANTYAYKTDHYMLATAQSYHPGSFGDQQHIWSATLSNDVNVFTTHPASSPEEGGGTPNYWVGSGRLPHAVQNENINLSMYILPNHKGLLEESLLYYTHAYFPKDLMDDYVLDGRYIFGRVGDTYISMIGKNPLAYKEGSRDDLIQMGQETYWITELSDAESETFEGFMARIYDNKVYYGEAEHELIYRSKDQELELSYQASFLINDVAQVTEYKRHEGPYAMTDRKADTMTFSYKGYELYLDFYKGERIESYKKP